MNRSGAWRVPMLPRDTAEVHRVATPLELFFDLCFVVAIAQAADRLHHSLAAGHPGDALIAYPMVFFAIWWAWMNVTWFGSAYDNDDVLYRVAVLVQIAGALVIAAGVTRAFDERNFTVATAGYTVLRVALIGQWLRVARNHPEGRHSALRYAGGLAILQVSWISLLAVPSDVGKLAGFVVLAACELLVPVYAERAGATPWHPGHIAERYGLFTIIVLGESVAAAAVVIQSALDAGTAIADLAALSAGGLLVVYAMWWIYFDLPAGDAIGQARVEFDQAARRAAFAWGYGHLAVFASAAAVGAGLQVSVDTAVGRSVLSTRAAGATVAIPVAAYLLSVWALHFRYKPPGLFRLVAVPLTAVLVLGAVWLAEPVLALGAVLTGLVVAWRLR